MTEHSPKPTTPEAGRERIRTLLEHFDFQPQVLENIIAERMRRSGANVGKGLDSVKKVEAGTEHGIAAVSSPLDGTIAIDIDSIDKYADIFTDLANQMTDWSQDQRNAYVHDMIHYLLIESFVHEYGHIRAGVTQSGRPHGQGRLYEFQIGYQTHTFGGANTDIQVSDLNLALNEAVTEKLARELYDEYARQVGDAPIAKYGKAALDGFVKLAQAQGISMSLPYENALQTLDLLIEHVAKELETSKEAIWNGFQQGYFSRSPGIHTFLQEVSEFLAEESSEMALAGPDAAAWDPTEFEKKLQAWEKKREQPISNRYLQVFGETKTDN